MVSAFEIGKGWRRQNPSHEKSVESYRHRGAEYVKEDSLKLVYRRVCPLPRAVLVILTNTSVSVNVSLVKSKAVFSIQESYAIRQ